MTRTRRHSAFRLLAACLATICFMCLCAGVRANNVEGRTLIVVVGAPGSPEYEEDFSAQAALWKDAAERAGVELFEVGGGTDASVEDKTRLLKIVSEEALRTAGELWIVFIGHGTYDGRSAKFNLRGPDVSANELALVLKPCKRPLAIIQCSSASGPFLSALAGPGRTIITATRSGHEVNATRFGRFFAAAIGSPAADLDKDGQTSLLEAYLMASRQVEQFYREEGRLATEHALLDDTGDGLGTPAEWFRGVRAVKSAADGKPVDGVRAHQMHLVRSAAEEDLSPEMRATRDNLERELSALRSRKSQMNEADYYGQLETILLRIAALYQSAATNQPAVAPAQSESSPPPSDTGSPAP